MENKFKFQGMSSAEMAKAMNENLKKHANDKVTDEDMKQYDAEHGYFGDEDDDTEE